MRALVCVRASTASTRSPAASSRVFLFQDFAPDCIPVALGSRDNIWLGAVNSLYG